MHRQHLRNGRDLGDRGKIALRIERQLRIQRSRHRIGGIRTEQQRIAIGRRFRHVIGPHDTAAAGTVVHDHRRLPRFVEPLRDRACEEIRRAAAANATTMRTVLAGYDASAASAAHVPQAIAIPDRSVSRYRMKNLPGSKNPWPFRSRLYYNQPTPVATLCARAANSPRRAPDNRRRRAAHEMAARPAPAAPLSAFHPQ